MTAYLLHYTEHLLSTAAAGDDAVGYAGGSTASPTASTSVLLVTELIRLTLKKLQVALEENRINDDDLLAMAMAVDAGAVSAALQAARGTAPAWLKTSTSLPVNLQTSNMACSAISGSGFGVAEFQSSVPSSTDRALVMICGGQDQPDTLSSTEIAAVAKKVINDVMGNLIER